MKIKVSIPFIYKIVETVLVLVLNKSTDQDPLEYLFSLLKYLL